MAFVTSVYGIVAAVSLAAGLISTPRPRSNLLIALAALLWPVTMAAVAVQALLSSGPQSGWAETGGTEAAFGSRGGVRAIPMSDRPFV